MTLFLNGILHARDLPLTPEIAIFIASGSLTPEFTLGEELYRPLLEQPADADISSGRDSLTEKDAENPRQPTRLSRRTQCAEHSEVTSRDRDADVAPDDCHRPFNQGLGTPPPDELELRPMRPSKQGTPLPLQSGANRENAQPTEQGLDWALTGDESALLECLGNTQTQLEPLPSFEDIFDFEWYGNSATASSARDICSPESFAGSSTLDPSYRPSVMDEDGEKQPKKASPASGLRGSVLSDIHPSQDDEDDEIILLGIRPAAKIHTVPPKDNNVTVMDGFALEQKKKPVARATRRLRTTTARASPYNYFTSHHAKSATKKKLQKWDVFVEEWPQIDEALRQRPELRDQLANVRGYMEIVGDDSDFDLWKGPLLKHWELLKKAVGRTDEKSVVDWAEGMLIDVFGG